jgi:uncharacterized protein (DUF4415 family)
VIWTSRDDRIRLISARRSRHAETERITQKTASEIRADLEQNGSKTDWARLDAMTEAEIEHNPVDDALGHGFTDYAGPVWEGIPAPFGSGKQRMSVRIDHDVVEWFKSQGKGYQTRMNAALREYMERHRS